MKVGFKIHRLMLAVGAVLWLILLLTCTGYIVLAIQEGNLIEVIWFPFVLIGLFSALMSLNLYFAPEVILAEEGIYVRVLLRQRFYRWSEIKQAGILFHLGRGIPYEHLYLVTPMGSKRRYRDKYFEFRNLGRLIIIPAGKEICAYVISHYGPLDFDLSYGKSEQSIVVD